MRTLGRVLLAMLAVSSLAVATTIIPMSVEELARAATHIVEGEAIESRSLWNAQHTLIYTYTTIAVRNTLKGTQRQTLTVKQLGGSADGYTQKVAGLHGFQNGESALLFLRPSAAGDGTMVIVGLMQGRFHIYRGESGDMVANIAGAAVPLNEAENRIARAMTK